MNKYLKLWKKHFFLELASEMTYKTNFFIKVIAFVIMDLIGPLITFVIYTSTSGIPGWSFYEFLFFQGTLTLVLGMGHFLILTIPGRVANMVQRGLLDKHLVKPVNTLGYISVSSIDLDGIAEICVGTFLVIYAGTMLNLGFSSAIFMFLFLIFLGLVFQYALAVLVASFAFYVVKSSALIDLFFNFMDFARYPSDIFPGSIKFFIMFVFPVAVSSYLPAKSLLHSVSLATMAFATLSVFAFLVVAIIMWNIGIKKYSSAGG